MKIKEKYPSSSLKVTADESRYKETSPNLLTNEPKAQATAMPATMCNHDVNISLYGIPLYDTIHDDVSSDYSDNKNTFCLDVNLNISYATGTVNKTLSTRKCSGFSAKPVSNTSIKAPIINRGKQNTSCLSKATPKYQLASCGFKMKPISIRHPSYLKILLNAWIEQLYTPAYFLTVRLPKHWETANYFNAKSHLRMIMKVFERSLLGKYWNENHLPFIAFAEQGAGSDWHYHLLLAESNFSDTELQNAIEETNTILHLSLYCLLLKPITNQADVVKFYSEKEIKVNLNGHFDSDRLIFSHDLFHLKYKMP